MDAQPDTVYVESKWEGIYVVVDVQKDEASKALVKALRVKDRVRVKGEITFITGTFSKNGKPNSQPINALDKSFPKLISGWLKDKNPDELLWAGSWWQRAAEMIENDLGATDIDFHCLRTTYITNLCLAGYFPKTVQLLAQHESMETSMKYYAKVTPADVFKEIATKSK